jgi:hypothetical protein
MRTGVKLETILDEIREETGLSTHHGSSVFSESRLKQMVNRSERVLNARYELTALQKEEQVSIAANAQYANLPTSMTFTEIDSVFVSYGDDWLPVSHGITPAHRAQYDSTQRAMPISRWEIQSPGNVNFEVWPVGGSAQTLLFSGFAKLGGMNNPSDTCTIDADALVMFVAAQILARDKKEDAEFMMTQAVEHIGTIAKKQGALKRGSFSMAGGATKTLRPGIDYIPPES